MSRLDFEYSRGDLRRAMITVYGNTCRIGWCQERHFFSYKDAKRRKRRTIEHIHPLHPPTSQPKGIDGPRNTTLACEYCNNRKSNDVSNTSLIEDLQLEAQEHFIVILKELLKKHITLTGTNKGFYRISILAYIYGIRITRKGTVVIIEERPMSSQEKVLKRLRDKETYADTELLDFDMEMAHSH
jgi:hypothetical protein